MGAENFCNSRSPDDETIALMQSILHSKPLSCDDIKVIEDARTELSRIRQLIINFEQSNIVRDSSTGNDPDMIRNLGRNAIHAEENFNDYVKRNIAKEVHIRRLIYDAIQTNVMFGGLLEEEMTEIVDIFEPCIFNAGDVIIRQGDEGDEFYVVEQGIMWMSISLNGEDYPLCCYPEGTAFGEHALIYGSPRAASITATTDGCKLWRIRRSWYRGVVGQHRHRLHMEKLSFLPLVKIGNKLFRDIFEEDQLHTMAQLLNHEYYTKGDTILRQGESGDSIYIIESGEVSIYMREISLDGPIGIYGKGYIFGENALLKDDVRGATVVAASKLVVCCVMTRGDFTRMIGNLQDIIDGHGPQRLSRISTLTLQKPVEYKLQDLEILNALGRGAFSKVKLVKAKDTGVRYALKMLGKESIVEKRRERYLLSEFRLMKELKHPNIVFMHCAMTDDRYIYFLLDLLPGGEVTNILDRPVSNCEALTRFYSASVILAYTEFYKHRILYRDLKPENILLDSKGYCVLVDFGLSKVIDGPTYTFCGTPDYMAPELIRGTGYTWAVDYWALGILLYELQSGSPPFTSFDRCPTGTATRILKGQMPTPPYPAHFSPRLNHLIKGLLVRDTTRRLGCGVGGPMSVMRQCFYAGFDWEGLLERRVVPPFVPNTSKNIGWKETGKDDARPSEWSPDLS